MALQVGGPATGADELPLPLITGYLDRYGLRADTIRVTSHDTEVPCRETWIGLTFSAADNLAALRGRSARIPLQQTAEVAARRLVDHLREAGWTAAAAAPEDIPELIEPSAPETWRRVRQGSDDYVAAYQVSVDDALPDTLAEIWSHPARETWTALEIAGNRTRRTLAVGCAYRTDHRPQPPSPGLTAQDGSHRLALRALDPLSTRRLDGHTDLPAELLARLAWPSAALPAGAVPPSSGAQPLGANP